MRLLVFAPCEKVIISEDENNPTLVAVLQQINGSMEVAAGENIGPAAFAPWRWSVFSLWRRDDGEEGRAFEQRFSMVAPNGTERISEVSPIRTDKQTHRITLKINHIPVRPTGLWWLRLYMREVGEEWQAEPIAEYPIRVDITITKGEVSRTGKSAPKSRAGKRR